MTRETPQHYIRDLRQQHSMAATHDNPAWYQHNMTTTWQQHNMAARQHGSNTTWQQHNMAASQNIVHKFLDTDNSTNGRKVETTMHHAKQPQLSVRVSMIESLNEEMEIKLSSLSVICSSFQSLAAANWKVERPRDLCALGTFKRM